MLLTQATKAKFLAINDIIYRNVFLLINGIIFIVAALLTIFGDAQAGIFLGVITFLNMVIAIVQETHAWLTLEKLQLAAAPQITRIGDHGREEIIPTEEIQKKDKLKIKIGDQIPCDGHLIFSHGLEVSEALITGESRVYLKKMGDGVLAGSIVTSGVGVVEADTTFAQSRISKMTKSIRKYSLSQSPIQSSLNKVIKYISYVLVAVILFVVGRGIITHEATVNIIQNIGALTSSLLPQGMIFVTTLLFTYGAINLNKRSILLQEINAIEKISRIKNLCIDKTGTLTDNSLVIEHVTLAKGISQQEADNSALAYIEATSDSSLTIIAIKESLHGVFPGSIVEDLSFSSSRQFGAVHVKDGQEEYVILVGAPDVFTAHLIKDGDKELLQQEIATRAKIGKRLICFTRSDSKVLPKDLNGLELSIICIYVLDNNLRDGAVDTINFFQDRGVAIRVISGDNLETVQAIAALANIKNTQNATTGAEIENWTPKEFLKNVKKHTIFARVKPEQKERIIESLKIDGYTAMVGDGANDALAIKKADVGIAMFDGAAATRQIAPIVLTHNSFSDLPKGVQLADTIIENIEIYTSLFFLHVFLAFFFFVTLAGLGYAFPFTPLNITFINYFTIGLPGVLIFYWIVRPVHTLVPQSQESFLKRVLPFPFLAAIPATLIALLAFYDSLEHVSRGPTSLVVLAFIMAGVIFFMLTPRVYSGHTTKVQKRELVILVVIETVLILVLFRIPLLAVFYDIKAPAFRSFMELLPWALIYGFVLFVMAKLFVARRQHRSVAA
jgi:cation-transporting ATPase E